MQFVVDASAAPSWCLEDEQTPWSDGLLLQLQAGGEAFVPPHWSIELANWLIMAARRKRISSSQAILLLAEIATLPIRIDQPSLVRPPVSILSLCTKHLLTAYDAAHLDLAMRMSIPLATLDVRLRTAALGEGVEVL